MLTLQYIPHAEISNLSSDARINKLLRIVKDNKIVLLEGKLKIEEEAKLIEKTMEGINKEFRGIEISTIESKKGNELFFEKLKKGLAKVLLGNITGLTVIGPATIVKEIRKDPNKIELLTKELKERRKRR